VIYGASGSDVIYDNSGNDYINGGGGDDTLVVGPLDDTTIGSSGNDIYHFSIGDGKDTIMNYVSVSEVDRCRNCTF